MGRPLKIAKAQAVITLTATNASTDVVTTSANLNTLGIIAGMPFIPASNIGGLVAGTTYWILKVLTATTFTVSATPLNANPTSTPVNLSGTTGQTVAATVAPVDLYFNNPNGSANTYSVVGGNTAIIGNQVSVAVAFGVAGVGTVIALSNSPNLDGVGTDFANTLSDGDVITTDQGVFLGVIDDIANANATFATFAANAAANVNGVPFVKATPEDGYIVRQKGKSKYLVKGTSTGITGAVYTIDAAKADLLPNTCSMTATFANAATAYVLSLSDHNAELYNSDTGNTPVEGNLVLANATPVYASFNTAAAANAANGQPYPIVTITGA